MDKRRRRLLVCLMIIFILVALSFILCASGTGEKVSGAAVMGSKSVGSPVWTIYLPGVLFIGMLILTVFYLEKKR